MVVSAPGKRQAGEAKITDLLYLCHDMAAKAISIDEPFGLIADRFNEIAATLGIHSAMPELLRSIRRDFDQGPSRDYTASRGEYLCARLMAEYLDAEFVDPADHIVLLVDGTVDPASYADLGARLAEKEKIYVMAGYYGRDLQGNIATFSRGGSDISGAIAARAAGAILYENWTDTSGILMADPRIVDHPATIEEISYREVREMSYMGAGVFHDEAILPVLEANIPVTIRNTNRPEQPGTRIVPKLSAKTLASTEIAGISGRTDMNMITIEKLLMNRDPGFAHRLLGIFRRHNIGVDHCPSSIDSISVIVEEGQLRGLDALALEDIRRQLQPDHVSVEKDLALIAVVGEGFSRTVGIAARIFTALAGAGVNVRIINQGASEINTIVGVAAGDYRRAVRALYQAFRSGCHV
jgi:aspartate kinase